MRKSKSVLYGNTVEHEICKFGRITLRGHIDYPTRRNNEISGHRIVRVSLRKDQRSPVLLVDAYYHKKHNLEHQHYQVITFTKLGIWVAMFLNHQTKVTLT